MFMLKCFIYIGYGTVLHSVWFCKSKQSEFLTSDNEGYVCLVLFTVNYVTIISITCFSDVSFNSLTGDLPQTMNSLSSISTM
jgi:hypothetical protein